MMDVQEGSGSYTRKFSWVTIEILSVFREIQDYQ